MRILVTGASGFVGSSLIPRLLADGHTVRALGRDPAGVAAALAQRPPLSISELEIVRADPLADEGLPRALAGIEVAYYLLHSMERPRPVSDRILRAATTSVGGTDAGRLSLV